MKSRRNLLPFGILALCLASAPGLYAQRGRSGGGGGGGIGGGGGLRGNSTTRNVGRPADAGIRPANAPGKPENSDSKGQEKKASSNSTAPDNKVAEQIGKNPQTAKHVQELLPEGMTLADASAGFKNRGQFIAALHVSKNLNIPFSDLKTKMTAADDSMSLGKSIHALKPGLTAAQVESETKKAEKQAKDTEKNS